MKRINHRILKLFFLLHFSLLTSYFSLFSLSLDETLNTLSSISNNVQFRWDPLFRDGVFNMGNHFGSFSIAAREGETGFLVINNRELYDVPLPYNNNGRLVFPETFVSTLKSTFTKLYENDALSFRVSTIIIDPGHGGRDPGAVRNMNINGKTIQIQEKDIVLNVSLQLRNLLSKTYPDKRILMTRDTDIFRTLDQRSDMANAVTVNENEAVIFISVHANASVNTNARGYEVWHITSGRRPRNLISASQHNYSADIAAILNHLLEEEFTTESHLLADSILAAFAETFGIALSRGKKANDWFVVRNSHMPAILVELGFVSNQLDAALMTSEDGLQKLTRSLYNGITNFIGIFER